MAQTVTPPPVEDIREIADTLNQLQELVPDEFTALDYLSDQLLGIAQQLEAQEVAA